MSITVRSLLKTTACLVLAATLAACGGGGGGDASGGGGGGGDGKPATTSYRFSGTVTGLAAGGQLKVKLNDNEALTVGANGPYSFAATLATSGSYRVTVTQPAGQTCSVANFSGAGLTGDVGNINVVCSTLSYAIGGAVSGLAAGAQLTLNNNGSDPLVVSANGSVSFAQRVAHNGSYVVTVDSQPVGQICTVSNGSGAGVTADVGNVAVTCAAKNYRIEGTVSGLASGAQVTLANNTADMQVIPADGAFAFGTPVAHNGSYAVTVNTQPVGQTCTVNNGSGAGVTGDVSNVQVVCSANTFAIGGTVSGLAAGMQVTLKNNDADPTIVNANGAFTFGTPVTYGGTYNVTVGTQPVGQTCTVSAGSGPPVTAGVSNVSVICSTNKYTIGGTVSGLAAGQQLTLNNNGADPTIVTADGTFLFATSVAHGSSYAVTVGTQPLTQVCTVTNGTGAGVAAAVTNVALQCVARSAYVYVAIAGSDVIAQYVAGPDGALTPMATATVPAGETPMAIAVHPSGNYAYAVNRRSGTVSQYSIDANGSLSPMASATVPAGDWPGSIAIESLGRYVYVVNTHSDSVSQYKVGADGSLTAMAPASVATGSLPWQIALHPTGPYAYVANYFNNTVSQYNVGADGALSPMLAGPAVITGAFNLSAVSVAPDGRFAYVSDFMGSTISQWAIGTDGALNGPAISAVTTGLTNPYALTFDPTGRYAYAPNTNLSSISQFAVDPVTGALSALSAGNVQANTRPAVVAVDPTGRFAFVSNYDGEILQFSIAADGALTLGSTTVGLNDPQGIAITPAR